MRYTFKPRLAVLLLAAAGVAAGEPPRLTAEQDHERLLGLLHIAALRPGADSKASAPPAAPNYDEAVATPYPELPDALTFRDGRPVRGPLDWKRRRREILEDFDREVYGRVPSGLPRVRWHVDSTSSVQVGGIAATRVGLSGVAQQRGNPASPVILKLELTRPATMRRPVPVILQLGFIGSSPFAEAPKPGEKAWQQQVLERGWGYAIFDPGSVQGDNGAGLTQGIIGFANRGRPRGLQDWGALRAWAWGASRALDYLQGDAGVDGRHVGIEGLSRYGKAALLAMAYDTRFAIGFIASSGAGGAKIQRRDFGERVENLAATGEYHWMAGNYLKYAGPLTPADLPVDAHELIALCAPRPVFVSAGAAEVEGGWIDARGTFIATAAAGPVYRLLGARDLGATAYPPPMSLLDGGALAWRQHEGGHTAGPNWPYFLDFAARYF